MNDINLFIDDAVISIQKNSLLTKNQYLIRIYSYNTYNEFRMDGKEIQELIEVLKSALQQE